MMKHLGLKRGQGVLLLGDQIYFSFILNLFDSIKN